MKPSLRRLRVSKLHRNIAYTLGGSLATQLGLVLSGVAAARILGVLDRGRSALLLLFASILSVVAGLGLPLSVTYWIAQERSNARGVLRRIRRTVGAQLAVMLIVHAAILAAVFYDAPGYVQISAAISLAGAPGFFIWIYALAVLQGNQQFRALNLCRLVFPPLNAAILVVFLATGVKSLVAVTAVWVGLSLLSVVVTVAAAARGLEHERPGTTVPSASEMRRFGVKGMLGSVTPLDGLQLDQAVVGLFVSQAALGIYVVAVAFTNLPRFVAQSIGTVAYPAVAADEEGHGVRRSIIRFSVLTLVLAGLTVAATELALPVLVPRLFGKAFDPAIGVARILLVSALIFALRRVLSECARGAGRPLLGSVAEVVCLIVLAPAIILLGSSSAKGVATALVVVAACGLATIIAGLVWGPPRWLAKRSRGVAVAAAAADGSATSIVE